MVESSGRPEEPLPTPVKMVMQSSKFLDTVVDDDDLPPGQKTPPTSPAHKALPPPALDEMPAPEEIQDSPSPPLKTPKSRVRPSSKSAVWGSSGKGQGSSSRKRPASLKLDLFQRKPAVPSEASQALKPEGYWNGSYQDEFDLLCTRMQPHHIHAWGIDHVADHLRVRRHFKPNSKGEVKCSPRVLELGKDAAGRTLDLIIYV